MATRCLKHLQKKSGAEIKIKLEQYIGNNFEGLERENGRATIDCFFYPE